MISINNVLLTIILSLFMAAGQIVLSIAAKELFVNNKLSFELVLSNIFLWIGGLIYIFSFFLWIYILSRFDVRYAYPISATAIIYVGLFQSILSKNWPSQSYWYGVVVVIFGLWILVSEMNE